jgi:hypothetical protein
VFENPRAIGTEGLPSGGQRDPIGERWFRLIHLFLCVLCRGDCTNFVCFDFDEEMMGCVVECTVWVILCNGLVERVTVLFLHGIVQFVEQRLLTRIVKTFVQGVRVELVQEKVHPNVGMEEPMTQKQLERKKQEETQNDMSQRQTNPSPSSIEE